MLRVSYNAGDGVAAAYHLLYSYRFNLKHKKLLHPGVVLAMLESAVDRRHGLA